MPFCNCANCYNILYSFRCHCVAGFTGTHCESNINECQSNPCKNQATCVDELNSYNCKCQPGFSGSRCETGICELNVVKNDTKYRVTITTSIFTCTKHNLYTKNYVKHFVLIQSSQPSSKLAHVISSSTEEEVELRDARVKWRESNLTELFTFCIFRRDTWISHLIQIVQSPWICLQN